MKILAIRLRLVGDVVFTTPALRALRRRFPQAHITYVVEGAAAPVVLGNPHVNDVIVVAHRRGWRRLLDDVELARTLRRRRFDLAIDFHGGPRSSWLARASGARRRIGYAIPFRTWMYSDPVSRPRELRARHSVENQWDLLGPLGIEPPDPARDPVEMPEDAAARAHVDAVLAAAGVPPGADVVVVHVSAGNPFRRWPAASFMEAAARLVSADPARHIVFTAGPSDVGAARSIAAATRDRIEPHLADRIVLCDEFDLAQLRALIGRAAVYIGGDSGPLHIAAATDTPIVGLYGPTLPARSAPWRPRTLVSEVVQPGPLPCRPCNQRRCDPGDFRCLTSITAEAVVAAAERAIARGRRTHTAEPQPSLA